MKYPVPAANLSFNASAGTITFSTTIPTGIENIMHVANVTRGVIYYQPQAGSPFSGTYSSPTLTLNASTAGHSNTDKLFVIVDDGLTPLTDTELRAAAVPVTSTVATRTPATTSVASSTSSVTILEANANRRGVSIFNDSTATLRLSFSTPAAAENAFVGLPAGAFLLLDQQLIVTGAIYGIWASENGMAQVTEYV